MSVKCEQCGLETSLESAFFKDRKSFSSIHRFYCPNCWQKVRNASVKKWLLMDLVVGIYGVLTVLFRPDSTIGYLLCNLFLFQIFLILTIVPHELGHALTARSLGLRVFKICIGTGQNVWKFDACGFRFEIQAIPVDGLVLAAARGLDFLRTKCFVYIAAGPMVNFLMASVILPFLDFETQDLWPTWSMGVFPKYAFFYANVFVLVVNLWPRNVTTSLGNLATDGKQLFTIPFMSLEQRKQHHVTYYLLEAGWHFEQGKMQDAFHCLERGLQHYPDNLHLLTSKGSILLEMGEVLSARNCLKDLLNSVDDKQPQLRAHLLNNIAYSDVLYGGEEYIKEADTFSKEAFDMVGWNPAIRGTRGAVLVALGQIDEGITLLLESMDKTTELHGKAQNACLIAEAECFRGNLELGSTYLQEARKLDSKCMLIPRVEKLLAQGHA